MHFRLWRHRSGHLLGRIHLSVVLGGGGKSKIGQTSAASLGAMSGKAENRFFRPTLRQIKKMSTIRFN
jgi:hypothetical protein